MKKTLISGAGTGAILAANAIPFTVQNGDFRGNSKPSLTVVGLATGETATITKNGQIVRNGVITFDDGEGSVALESAGEFAFYKDATAADVDLVLENSN